MLIKVNLQRYAGTSDEVRLYLIDPDGELVASVGDELTEVDNGLFETTVAEDLEAAHYVAEIYVGSVLRYQGWLVPEVSGLIDDHSSAAELRTLITLFRL